MTRFTLAALLLIAPALAACDNEPEDKTYVTDTVDKSGGELIVRDADQPGVEVNVPETPMTNVPAGEEAPAPAASPDAPRQSNNDTLQMGTATGRRTR